VGAGGSGEAGFRGGEDVWEAVETGNCWCSSEVCAKDDDGRLGSLGCKCGFEGARRGVATLREEAMSGPGLGVLLGKGAAALCSQGRLMRLARG